MPGVQVLFALPARRALPAALRRRQRLPARRLPGHAALPPRSRRRSSSRRAPITASPSSSTRRRASSSSARGSSLCGLVALAVAMTGAVLLVTDFLFQTTTVDRSSWSASAALFALAVVRHGPVAAAAAMSGPRRSSTSTARSSTPTTSTRSRGTARSASTTSTSPIWRIHRHIGMGGDQLVAALCGDEVEERQGEDIRAAEKALYMAIIDEVEPLHGARDADRRPQAPGAPRGPGQLGEARRDRALPRPARRPRPGRRLDERRRRRADQARARPRATPRSSASAAAPR